MNRGTKRPKGGAEKKREKTKKVGFGFTTPVYKREIIEKMFRSIVGLKFFARPRSSRDMDSSSKKSKRRSERPSSPEDLNPATILREHRRRGESPLSCAENQPSTTRQHVRRGESPSSSSSEDDEPSTTRQRVRRAESPSSSSSEDKQPSTPRRQQAWRGESPSSSSSEDDQRSTTRRQQQQSPLSFVDINLSTTFRQNGGIGENHLPCIDSLI
ncbi:zinc finger Ran-binding domain-containing protein 2-like isoform X2 [Sander lucioperca]|uniref:zinc finger Ran-binding domain-containing protein 2-like isoform X2 n=1 Tax=Sander lucioperca TaxID=283035 RepID=UPI00125D7CD7|nr:zinc finger Ran-binding domain-containing protein 2-like isoform X2 [Sander lucioperca]